MTLEEAAWVIREAGYVVTDYAESSCLVGGSSAEPSGWGDVQLVQEPFRVEKEEGCWCVYSWPEGQVRKEKEYPDLESAVGYIVRGEHLEYTDDDGSPQPR